MRSDQLIKLMRQHSAALVLFARQWCRWPDDAVQEAFVELSNLKVSPREPVAWLFTVTKRRALNQSRSETRRQRHLEQYAADQMEWFHEHRNNEKGLDSEAIRVALSSLPGEYREIIVSRVWGQLSFAQIAEVFDCSVSSAHRRYEKALQMMRQITVCGAAGSKNSITQDTKNEMQPSDY